MNLLKYFKATALCIRFPFLYPRNRFTGLHYNNWNIIEFHRKWWKHTEDFFGVNTVEEKADLKLTPATTIEDRTYTILKRGTDIIIYCGRKVIFKKPISAFGKGKILRWGFNDKHSAVIVVENDYERSNDVFFAHNVHAKWLRNLIKFFDWINEYPLQIFHCMTDYTELDAMPEGWRRAFGMDICKEIRAALYKEFGLKGVFNYRIEQIKEKYGSLRWYDARTTHKIQEIISKYEEISSRTCINCGAPATWISNGWISPYCDKCIGDTTYASRIDANGNIIKENHDQKEG